MEVPKKALHNMLFLLATNISLKCRRIPVLMGKLNLTQMKCMPRELTIKFQQKAIFIDHPEEGFDKKLVNTSHPKMTVLSRK